MSKKRKLSQTGEYDDLMESIEEDTKQVEEAKKEVEEAKKEVEKAEKEVEEAKAEVADAKNRSEELLVAQTLVLAEVRKNLAENKKDLAEARKILGTLVESKKQKEDTLAAVKSELLIDKIKHRKYNSAEVSHEFVEPSPLTDAASKVKSKDVKDRMSDGDVYHHWFALALYNLRVNLQKQLVYPLTTPQIEFTFLNERMSISSSLLTNAVKFWFHELPEEMPEIYYTAGIAVELDRFLFPTDDTQHPLGSCLHQLPLHDSLERPDFFVLPYPNEHYGYDSSSFVAVSDFKVDNLMKAETESFAYALKGSKGYHDRVRLVFPCTKYRFKLIIAVPQNRRLLSIYVYDSESDDVTTKQKLRLFLCILYAAVHYLLKHPIDAKVDCLYPKRDLELQKFPNVRTESVRVFVDRGCEYVYKLFDNMKDTPQLEITRLVLNEAEVENLSDDGRYSCLKYRYRSGSYKNPPKAVQFRDILSQLHKIHERGYVHSDVRLLNIVFHSNGREAWLIDFELADKEDTPYPRDYNHCGIDERHPMAFAGLPRKKIHDVHALDIIITRHGFPSILNQYTEGKSLFEIAANDFTDTDTK